MRYEDCVIDDPADRNLYATYLMLVRMQFPLLDSKAHKVIAVMMLAAVQVDRDGGIAHG